VTHKMVFKKYIKMNSMSVRGRWSKQRMVEK